MQLFMEFDFLKKIKQKVSVYFYMITRICAGKIQWEWQTPCQQRMKNHAQLIICWRYNQMNQSLMILLNCRRGKIYYLIVTHWYYTYELCSNVFLGQCYIQDIQEWSIVYFCPSIHVTKYWFQVSRHLFRWTKEVSYADYYERALTNGVLGVQRGTDPGVMIYMLPLANGVSKAKTFHGWGTPFNSFWCCYGTGG